MVPACLQPGPILPATCVDTGVPDAFVRLPPMAPRRMVRAVATWYIPLMEFGRRMSAGLRPGKPIVRRFRTNLHLFIILFDLFTWTGAGLFGQGQLTTLPTLDIRLVHPTARRRPFSSSFTDRGAPHLRRRWRRGSGGDSHAEWLGKPMEAVISFFNPEMIPSGRFCTGRSTGSDSTTRRPRRDGAWSYPVTTARSRPSSRPCG